MAIAKAITGAYLSSGGNAFTTRTASQIIQENYNPLSSGLGGRAAVRRAVQPVALLRPFGPLRHQQYRQSRRGRPDHRAEALAAWASPADPGGLPLYKNGTLVGGVGVISDGVYGLARNKDADGGSDEAIALAATTGFGAPEQIRANRIVVDGRTLTFTNSQRIGQWRSSPTPAAVDLAAAGSVPGVSLATTMAAGRWTARPSGFGQSGILPDPDGLFQSDQAYVLADAAGVNRFPPTRRQRHHGRRGHSDPALGAWGGAASPRPDPPAARQLRRGDDLGRRHRRQYPRARAHARCAGVRHRCLAAEGAQRPVLLERRRVQRPADLAAECLQGILPRAPTSRSMQRFLGQRARRLAHFRGPIDRQSCPAILSRRRERPPEWPAQPAVRQLEPVQHRPAARSGLRRPGPACRFVVSDRCCARCSGASCVPRLGNGLQIFAGGVPIFRGQTRRRRHRRFRRRHRPGRHGGVPRPRSGRQGGSTTGIGQAPKQRRADRLSPDSANLRWVQCPFTPFNGSRDQSVCKGK